MENGAIDYESFVRGFVAATDRDLWGGPDGELNAAAYSDGFAAGTHRGEYPQTYRELSVQSEGKFSGTLDLDPEHNGHVVNGSNSPPVDAEDDDLRPLSGTLDLTEWQPEH